MYPVLRDFTDPEDKERTVYRKGGKYPRKGYKPTKARVTQLQTDKNKQGKPVIGDVIKESTAKK